MKLLQQIVIHTANILGIFTDPFEFDGDYGPVINPVRQKVFELVVSPEALANNLSDSQVRELMQDSHANTDEVNEYRNNLIKQAIVQERMYGPKLSQLVTPALAEKIKSKQIELQDIGFTSSDLKNILNFIRHYGDQKIFRFLRNAPPALFSLDKPLRDQASKEGRAFDLPILGSTEPLRGSSSFELKANLIEAVFTRETFALTKPQLVLKKSLTDLHNEVLKGFFGETANDKDLEVFCSPAGQVFFYWMYQALNLHLASVDQELIEQINQVKEIFAHTLGDPTARANGLKDKLVASNSGVLFTQESDAITPQMLTNDGLFLPVDRQNPLDGTFVFLRSDLWEPDYEIVPIEDYEGFEKGVLNVILATRKDSNEKFLLASCHGHSTRPADGRLQISLVMDKFHQLSDGNLQLLIGIDANTKSEADVQLFNAHLETLGLTATQAGPTTIKKRMVTAQHSKAGRMAIDQEDYLITLKPENGGRFQFTHLSVGFKEESPDIHRCLPNVDNPSDHYPVGAIPKMVFKY